MLNIFPIRKALFKKNDIYLISSPFPLVSAINHVSYNRNKCIFIVLDEPGSVDLSDTAKRYIGHNLISVRKNKIEQLGMLFSVVLVSIFGRVENLYVGNIGITIFAFIYNFISAKNKVIFEDGMASVVYSKIGNEFFNRNIKYNLSLGVSKYIELHGEHNLYTMFNLKSKHFNVIENNLSRFKQNNHELTKSVLIVGSPLILFGIMKRDFYYRTLKIIISYYIKNYNIENFSYKAHPKENRNDIDDFFKSFKSSKNYKILGGEILELMCHDSRRFPKFVVSLWPSTSLVSLKLINPLIDTAMADYAFLDVLSTSKKVDWKIGRDHCCNNEGVRMIQVNP